MATGGNFTRTIESGHEPFYDFPCSLCEGEGKHAEGVKYCEECFVYMCDTCVRNHDKFPLHKRHQLLDKSKFTAVNKTALVSFPTTRCSKHPGELVNIYCGDHDIVCCSVCKALEHSTCVNTVHLPDASRGVKTSSEYGSIKKDIKLLISNVDKVLNDCKADISRIKDQKQRVKQTIADFREKIIEYFDGLEKNSLDELEVKEKAIIGAIDEDKMHLETTRQKAIEVLKELESFKGDNECDLFVHVKAGNNFIEDTVQTLSLISKTETKPSIHFEIDNEFEEYLMSLKALGSFISKTATGSQISQVSMPGRATSDAQKEHTICSQQHDNIMPQFIGKFDVREKSDTLTCYVTSICLLQNGTFVISDWNNKKIKWLDQSFKLQYSVKLSNEPHCVCLAGSCQVAVSVTTDKKIQFVSVEPSLTLTRSFIVRDCCRGIVCVDSNIFVCCGPRLLNDSSAGNIEVYNMAGQLQRIIAYTCGSLPAVPVWITVSDDRTQLVVTCSRRNVVTMLDLEDSVGNVAITFSHNNMVDPRGFCVDGGSRMFVCGHKSNTVVQLSTKHQKVEVVLREEDGIKKPTEVFYDGKRSKLIVSCLESNELIVYSLK